MYYIIPWGVWDSQSRTKNKRNFKPRYYKIAMEISERQNPHRLLLLFFSIHSPLSLSPYQSILKNNFFQRSNQVHHRSPSPSRFLFCFRSPTLSSVYRSAIWVWIGCPVFDTYLTLLYCMCVCVS